MDDLDATHPHRSELTMATIAQTITGKAVVYTRTGGYDVIEVIEREVPTPGDGEVRIRVAAAAVNPTDVLFRDPGMPGQEFPVVPGMEAAGVIDAVGPDVSRLVVGDRVIVVVSPRRPGGGAQAAHVLASEASVVAVPDGVPLADISTLPMNGLTALLALELAGGCGPASGWRSRVARGI